LIIDYFFDLFLSRFDKEKIEEKKEIVRNLAPFILNIPNEIEKTFWLEKISKELKIKEEDLRKELAKIKLVKNEIETSEKTNVFSKSRREILEEKLLCLVLQEPSFLDKITTEDFIFFSSLSQEILKGLKEKKESSFPPEIKNFYDYLFLKSEIERLEPSILEKEFNFCKKEIVRMTAREKLEEISKRVQEAEKEKNEEMLKELNKEFKFWAEKIK
jgi:DNA primase